MASVIDEGDDQGAGGPQHVPLEPYPAPPFQAIDQQGYEYPPRVVPPDQAFEAMVRRLDLMHHATKKRRRSRLGASADLGRTGKGSPTEEAEARVGEALQSVEEAMRDLLIAADLVHVIRGGPGGSGSASFIGQDKVADTASLLMAARGMQQKRALPSSLKPLPVSHIPPEVILGMKQQGLAEAARRMAEWTNATRASLHKGRRLLGEMVGLRRRARLRAGFRNAALPRPLSAGDPLSVVVDTAKGAVVLPFETDGATGAPRVLGLGAEEGEEGGEEGGEAGKGLGYGMLRVSLLDPTRGGGTISSSASVAVGTPLPARGQGLAGAVRALEAEARLGRLFAALQREAAAPRLAWVDRHGVLLPAAGAASGAVLGEGAEEEEEGSGLGGGGGGKGLRVVRCGEGSVAVEAGGALVLKVELLGAVGGESSHRRRHHHHHHGPSPAAEASDAGEQVPPVAEQQEEEGLRSLCRLAALRLLELGARGGEATATNTNTNTNTSSILAPVTALVAHRRYMDALLPALARVAGKSRRRARQQEQQGDQRAIEAVRWVEYPFAAPRSRLVLQGAGGAFAVDVLVEGAAPTLVWTDARGASRRVTEVGRVADVEACLQRLLVVG